MPRRMLAWMALHCHKRLPLAGSSHMHSGLGLSVHAIFAKLFEHFACRQHGFAN